MVWIALGSEGEEDYNQTSGEDKPWSECGCSDCDDVLELASDTESEDAPELHQELALAAADPGPLPELIWESDLDPAAASESGNSDLVWDSDHGGDNESAPVVDMQRQEGYAQILAQVLAALNLGNGDSLFYMDDVFLNK